MAWRSNRASPRPSWNGSSSRPCDPRPSSSASRRRRRWRPSSRLSPAPRRRRSTALRSGRTEEASGSSSSSGQEPPSSDRLPQPSLGRLLADSCGNLLPQMPRALSAVDPPSKELMKVGSTQSMRRCPRRSVLTQTVLVATIGLGLTVSSNPVDARAAGDPISLFTLLADENGEKALAAPSVESPFRFDLREVTNHRGPAVEGYLYNGLRWRIGNVRVRVERSEEHTSELQSRLHLVCRLLLEKKK